MRLIEAIGKKVIRRVPVRYVVQPGNRLLEDQSFMDKPVYVRGITAKKIHVKSPIHANYKWVKHQFDVGGPFDDANWVLYDSKKKV